MEQDSLIAQQNEGIENLSHRLNSKELSYTTLRRCSSKPGQELNNALEGLEKEKLERANKNMEALIEEFEEGFWTLFSEQRQGLDECLEALEELPVTSETKSLYAHVKNEWQAIEAAKKRNIITPVNALRQLADLETGRCNIHPGQAQAELDHRRGVSGRGSPGRIQNRSQIETAYH